MTALVRIACVLTSCGALMMATGCESPPPSPPTATHGMQASAAEPHEPLEKVPGTVWANPTGHYRLSFLDAPPRLALGESPLWHVRVTDNAGSPVANARIEVVGSMPQHGHGLPTTPLIRPAEKPGDYLVEGLHFHMPGVWELEFVIGDGADKHERLKRALLVQ